MIIWFTGLSGSGKSTLAGHLETTLQKAGFSVYQVDGDIFRQESKTHDKFSKEAIIENNLSIIYHCQEIQKQYDAVIVAVISPYQQTRNKARKVFGKKYLEIFLDCPLEVLIKNDVKKLYQKAKKGEIKNMIGFHDNSPYQRPNNPEITIRTDKTSIGDSIKEIIKVLQNKYGFKL